MSKYYFAGCCPDFTSQDILDLREGSKQITRKHFLTKVDPEQMKELEADLGYSKSSPMAKDAHIGYFSGVFKGDPSVYFAWSGFEYIFVKPKEAT